MIELHLFGKLRRFAADKEPTGNSVVNVPAKKSDDIKDILLRVGIPLEEVGRNVFLNRQYSALDRRVQDGDRLAVFPDNMQLLYRQYFRKVGSKDDDRD
ncbi:MoaD/ThiS family protein [Chloroflexota bacterium]